MVGILSNAVLKHSLATEHLVAFSKSLRFEMFLKGKNIWYKEALIALCGFKFLSSCHLKRILKWYRLLFTKFLIKLIL